MSLEIPVVVKWPVQVRKLGRGSGSLSSTDTWAATAKDEGVLYVASPWQEAIVKDLLVKKMGRILYTDLGVVISGRVLTEETILKDLVVKKLDQFLYTYLGVDLSFYVQDDMRQ